MVANRVESWFSHLNLSTDEDIKKAQDIINSEEYKQHVEKMGAEHIASASTPEEKQKALADVLGLKIGMLINDECGHPTALKGEAVIKALAEVTGVMLAAKTGIPFNWHEIGGALVHSILQDVAKGLVKIKGLEPGQSNVCEMKFMIVRPEE
jgi:hypothetical protein